MMMESNMMVLTNNTGSKKKILKRSWTEAEDAKLLELVRVHGTKVSHFCCFTYSSGTQGLLDPMVPFLHIYNTF